MPLFLLHKLWAVQCFPGLPWTPRELRFLGTFLPNSMIFEISFLTFYSLSLTTTKTNILSTCFPHLFSSFLFSLSSNPFEIPNYFLLLGGVIFIFIFLLEVITLFFQRIHHSQVFSSITQSYSFGDQNN